MNPTNRLACAAVAWALLATGCTTAPPAADAAATAYSPPPAWQSPLPHSGSSTDLAHWWQSLGDPLLVELIESAERVSPTLASATSRLAQARATLTGADAANRPGLTASASAQRGVTATSPTVGTALQASLDASWEIDLFGANRNTASAAQARLQGSTAQWHEARVSVAADTANAYIGWRNCHQLLAVVQADAASRAETARLADLSMEAGFTAPAVAALARASAAEGQSRIAQQSGQCEAGIKALVALTGIEEPALRERLQAAPQGAAELAMPAIASVPAQVLVQRPDLYAAERELAAASAELGAAEAQRYPRLMLAGSVGALNYTTQGSTTDLSTWSIGPVTLSLPILDGGRRVANVEAAQARYTEAASLYRARARQAVREVEEALLQLATSAAQQEHAATAARGYAESFQGTQARYRAGAASLPELEDARRTDLAAQTTLLQLALQRSQAWIALYRALGGGWTLDAPQPPAGQS